VFVVLQTIESTRAQDKIEIEHLQELVTRAKEKADRDKEALKKATRSVKQWSCLYCVSTFLKIISLFVCDLAWLC
jgi:hypothetical protein